MPSSAHDQLRRALDADARRATSGPTPSDCRWCASRLARRVQLAVGQPLRRHTDGDGVRRARRLRLEQLVRRRRRAGSRHRRVVPARPGAGAARRRGISGSARQRRVGGVERAGQQHLRGARPCARPSRRRRDRSRTRARRRRPSRARLELQRQVELGLPASARRRPRWPGRPRCVAAAGRVLQANITWKSGVRPGRAPAASASTSRSKGTSWCAKAPGRGLRPAPSSVANDGSPSRSRAQHQRVDEEADEPLGLRPRAVGHRRADEQVLLPRVARRAAPGTRANRVMNSVAPSRAAQRLEARAQLGRRAESSPPPPRDERTAGRGRSVGSSSGGALRRASASSRSTPARRRRRRAASRCQRGEVGVLDGQIGGSGDGSPSAKARVAARTARDEDGAADQPSATMWCIVTRST